MIWKRQATLEQLNRLGEGNMVGLLDIRFETVTDDTLEATMPVDSRTQQPFGLLHGGASVVLAETLGSVVINPAAFTHTSVAIRDALLAVNIPFIEIHLSNVYAREPFRQHSYLSDVAAGVICGLGADGYSYALQTAVKRLSQSH